MVLESGPVNDPDVVIGVRLRGNADMARTPRNGPELLLLLLLSPEDDADGADSRYRHSQSLSNEEDAVGVADDARATSLLFALPFVFPL